MSTPHGQGGDGRASKSRTPVAPTNTIDHPTPSPMHQAHTTACTNPFAFVDPTHRPLINRRPSGQTPTAGSERQNMSPFIGENQSPGASSAIRKRGRGSFADVGAQLGGKRAAKRPANASTRSDSASGGASVAQVGMFFDNMNEGATSSAAERMKSMSPGEVEPDAAGMSMEAAYVKREQPSADMMRPSTSENYKTTASTRAPVKDGQWGRPRSESIDRSAHGGYRQTQGVFRSGAPVVKCRACHSQKHKTKECPVPSSDGTVVICPFHDCTVLDKSVLPCHPLDGLTKYNPGDSVKTPLYCDQLMRYEIAVESNNTARIRHMLPEVFKELVLNRRRKPCCRVVNKEVCFINIAIEYSMEFCHGKMPAELQGKWPYTMRDATDLAMLGKLRKYDYPGLDGMPPGELESKPWEQIKREYAQGIIPPQIHSKHRPYYRVSTPTPTTAEMGDAEAHQHAVDTEVEPQAVHEDGEVHSFPVQQDAVQSQDPVQTDVIIQMLSVLTENVNTLSEQVNTLSSLPEQVNTLSEQVAALSTSHENVDALSALREQIAAVSEKVDVVFQNKKAFLQKIVDSMP